jgi:CRP/FNR family transcriptional regulator
MNFATTGDMVAAFIMTQENPIYPVSAIAMGPSRLLKLPRKVYLERWKNYPDIIFKIQSLLSTKMAFFQKQKSLTKAPLSAKVASLLIEILQKNESQNKQTLSIPLTRKEIADNLGASVESVIRIMSLWSKNNIIETRDHEIAILKLDKLIEFANE